MILMVEPCKEGKCIYDVGCTTCKVCGYEKMEGGFVTLSNDKQDVVGSNPTPSNKIKMENEIIW